MPCVSWYWLCTVCLDSWAWPWTSCAADWPSCLTVWAASVAVDRTSSTACWATGLSSSPISWATCLAGASSASLLSRKRGLGLLGQLLLLLRGGQEAGHQPADAEGDQPGGQGVALRLADDLVRRLLHGVGGLRGGALHRVRGAGGGALHRARGVLGVVLGGRRGVVRGTHHLLLGSGDAALGRGDPPVHDPRGVDLLVEGVDVVAELAPRLLDLPADDVRVVAGGSGHLWSSPGGWGPVAAGQEGFSAPGTCERVSTVRSGFGLTCWNFFLPIRKATAPTIPQRIATIRADQLCAHQVRQRPPQGDGQEHQHHVAGEAGGAEQARTRGGLRRLGLDLDLGELELLAHQGGEVLGDLAHQLADRGALDVGAALVRSSACRGPRRPAGRSARRRRPARRSSPGVRRSRAALPTGVAPE